jgi:hypothetical protein
MNTDIGPKAKTIVTFAAPASLLQQISEAAGYRGLSKFLRAAAMEKLDRDAWSDAASAKT